MGKAHEPSRSAGQAGQTRHCPGLCSRAREQAPKRPCDFGFCTRVKMDLRVKNEDLRGRIGGVKKFKIKMAVP